MTGSQDPEKLAAFKAALFQLFEKYPLPEVSASLKRPHCYSKSRGARSRIKNCKNDHEVLLRASGSRLPQDQVWAIHTMIYG